jgi:hypothetical protein
MFILNGKVTLMKIRVAIGCLVLVGLIGCSEATDPQPSEFVATDADFAGFTTWTRTTEPLSGPDPALGPAHEANDTNVVRYVTINNASATRGSNGQYSNGVIVVKEMKKRSGELVAVMAMAKRGNNFNASNNDWEWFVLDKDGKIQDRGANLMGGMCNGCHSAVKTTNDYVFTKD